MTDLTLEQIDKTLMEAPADLPVDDRALLWITRAALVGQPIRPEHLVYVMGISHAEAEDVFARLSEHGLIEQDET